MGRTKIPLCFLLITLGTMAVWLFSRSLAGPFWGQLSQDPDYLYLLNSLRILNLEGSNYYDHPGVTVQVHVALVLFIVHLIRLPFTSLDLNVDVLKNPEFFLSACSLALALLFILAISFTGRQLEEKYKTKWIYLFFAVLPAYHFLTFHMSHPAPDAFLVLFTILFIGVWEQSRETGVIRIWRWSIALTTVQAVVLALGLATKFVFAPIWILPLFQGRPLKELLRLYGRAIAFFILFLAPIWHGLVNYLAFFKNLIVQKASAPPMATLPTAESPAVQALLFVQTTLFKEPMLMANLAVVVALTAFLLGKNLLRSTDQPRENSHVGMIEKLGLALAVILSLGLFAGKYPQPRYVLPAMVVLSWFVMRLILDSNRRFYSWAFIGVAGISAFMTLKCALPEFENRKTITRDGLELFTSFKDTSCTKIFSYRTSAPAMALGLANHWAGSLFGDEMNAAYPNALIYDISNGRVFDFKNETVPNSMLNSRLEKECFELIGDHVIDEQYRKNLEVSLLKANNAGGVFKITRFNEWKP